MKKIIFILLMVISSLAFAKTAQEIIDMVDYNMYPKTAIYTGEMIIHKNDKDYTKKFKSYNVGEKKSFMEFLYPPRDKGTKYLRIDDNLWMYLPKANRTIKIAGHMLKQSMMGSDISYEDQTDRTKLNDLYNSKILKEDNKYYYIEMVAKPDTEVTYYKRIVTIEKDTYVFKSQEMYANSGKLLKVMEVEKYQKIGDRYYMTEFKMSDKLKQNTYTKIVITDIQLDIDIDENIFTIKNLEKR
ncbi:MAG: hypothetical protein PWP46_2126 [Fusobacteriaceae bacterium]|nr:hypothetical protein [Fusobacteriaceae bacterium]